MICRVDMGGWQQCEPRDLRDQNSDFANTRSRARIEPRPGTTVPLFSVMCSTVFLLIQSGEASGNLMGNENIIASIPPEDGFLHEGLGLSPQIISPQVGLGGCPRSHQSINVYQLINEQARLGKSGLSSHPIQYG